MPVVVDDVPLIPSKKRTKPPVKLLNIREDDRDTYLWYITEDEYLRLNQIFVGRDFQETGLGGTNVVGLPSPCPGCGKYTEFIDWVWTALRRGVHTREFMFNALKQGRRGAENMHDVYCSECGLLTPVRSRNNSEGGADAPTIDLAKPLNRSKYDLMPELMEGEEVLTARRPLDGLKIIVWGEWWLDDTGRTDAYRRARIAREQAEAHLRVKKAITEEASL